MKHGLLLARLSIRVAQRMLGGIWLHLVILVFVCLLEKLRMLQDSRRHGFELMVGGFVL